MQFTHTYRLLLISLVACAAGLAACGGGGGGGDGGGAPVSAPASPPAAPPPWGSVQLASTNSTARAFSRFVPNRVPIHVVDLDPNYLFLIWDMNNAYDARASLRPTDPHLMADVVFAYEPTTSGRPVGNLSFSLQIDPELPTGSRVTYAIKCGGGAGVFSTLPREAACDRLSFDPVRRVLRLSNVAIAGTDTVVNGELGYPDFTPRAEITGTAGALSSCPSTSGAGAVVLPPWDSAACLQGSYRGTSDTDKACTVTMNVTGSEPSVSVAIDGYTANYRYFARREAITSPINSRFQPTPRQQRTWDYWFTLNPSDGKDPAKSTSEAEVSGYLLTSFTDLPITPTATGPVQSINFFVFHRTAPAGVAGPVGVKTCVVPLR